MAGEVLAQMAVQIGAEIGDFERKITKVERSIFWLGNSVTSLGKRMTVGLSVPLVAAGAAAVKVAADMDSLRRGMIAVAGSAAEADRQMRGLRELSKGPGLGFAEAVQGSINLQAAGFSAELAARSLGAFGNALATVGKGKAELDGVTTALTQIASKGKISAEEINQLAERLPQIRKAMEAAFGTSNTEALQKLGISATEFVTKVVAEFEKLPKASGGAQNSLTNLAESMKVAGAAIGRELLPPVIALTDKLGELFDRLSRTNPEIIRWGIALGATVALVGPLTMALGGLAKMLVVINGIRLASTLAAWTAQVPLLSGALTILRGVLLRTALVLGAGGVVVAGLTLLSAWFVKNKLNAIAAKGAVDEYTASLRGMGREAAQGKLADLTRQIEETRAAIARTPKTVTGFEFEETGLGTVVTKETAVANPKLAELQTHLRSLYDQSGILWKRLSALANTSTEPLKTGLGEVDEKLKGLIDRSKELGLSFLESLDIRAAIDQIPLLVATAGRDARAQLAGVLRPEYNAAQGKFVMPNKPLPVIVTNPANMPSPLGRPRAGEKEGFLGSIGKGLGEAMDALKAKLTPAVLAAAAAFALLVPVFQGFRSVAGPAIQGLLYPLQIVGQVLGTLIVPVLRLLFPALKAVGIVAAMLGESIAAVVGWIFDFLAGIKEAFGRFVLALGNLLNKLPGSLGNPLVKYGRHLLEGAEQLKENAAAARKMSREFEKTQEELRDLSFEDAVEKATGAVEKFSESLTNVPPIFDLALRRRQAALGVGAPAPAVGGGLTPGTVQPTDRGGSLPGVHLHFHDLSGNEISDPELENRVVKVIQKPRVRYELQRAVGVAV
jgi:tape measure domain-containing protein